MNRRNALKAMVIAAVGALLPKVAETPEVELELENEQLRELGRSLLESREGWKRWGKSSEDWWKAQCLELKLEIESLEGWNQAHQKAAEYWRTRALRLATEVTSLTEQCEWLTESLQQPIERCDGQICELGDLANFTAWNPDGTAAICKRTTPDGCCEVHHFYLGDWHTEDEWRAHLLEQDRDSAAAIEVPNGPYMYDPKDVNVMYCIPGGRYRDLDDGRTWTWDDQSQRKWYGHYDNDGNLTIYIEGEQDTPPPRTIWPTDDNKFTDGITTGTLAEVLGA